eukprot:Opistho-2@79506
MATVDANPWAAVEPFPYVSLGGIDKALALAHQMGYDVPSVQAPAESPSVALIHLLARVSAMREQLDKLNNAIFIRLQASQSADVMSVTSIESKTAALQEVSQHLSALAAAKDVIAGRLQRPFVGECIEVEAVYQESVSVIFSRIAALLASLPRQLDNIAWIKGLPQHDARLDPTLESLAAVQATFQSTHIELQSMQSKIHELAKAR